MNLSGVEDLYASGSYDKILNDFTAAFGSDGHFPHLSHDRIITFGDHHDDNFLPGDIYFILSQLSSVERLNAGGSLGGTGHLNRGWYSSTFNRFALLFLSEIRTLICDQKKADGIAKTSEVFPLTPSRVATEGGSTPRAGGRHDRRLKHQRAIRWTDLLADAVTAGAPARPGAR